MYFEKNNSGFTLLEILLASAITVTLTTFAVIGTTVLLDYKIHESVRSKLAFEALQLLNEIEKDWENKYVALGNLLIDEPSTPLQFQREDPRTHYPSLTFFIHTSEGPKVIYYGIGSLTSLPLAIRKDATHAVGLFRFILERDVSSDILAPFLSFDATSSLSLLNLMEMHITQNIRLANLRSPNVVFLELCLIKKQTENPWLLEYLNVDAQDIEIKHGQWTLGTTYPKDIAFVEVSIGVLEKALHHTYFALPSMSDRKSFLARNGFRLSRLLRWRI
ncbi:MAG: prepilin-type N-terminal cleavage/methylation domain-containing protein [Puniceicoccales bacterium]|jgi:prepilin-type N-terminal cleavage/methylation domain-containing protein|nr:prepilin-type N-terminal cleavage/methylation domain-containing protein [Puniceicoccales bacterium]